MHRGDVDEKDAQEKWVVGGGMVFPLFFFWVGRLGSFARRRRVANSHLTLPSSHEWSRKNATLLHSFHFRTPFFLDFCFFSGGAALLYLVRKYKKKKQVQK